MADITGADVVGTARVLVELDTSKVASQFTSIQGKLSTTGAAPMEKAGVNHGKSYLQGFTKEFKKSTMAFSKIATGLKAVLKTISAPAIGFATYGVHELMKSSSVAGEEARRKWEEFHASFKKNAIRVGDILINKEVFGKTIDEWGLKLNNFLSNLSSTQINKFIDTIKSMATAIVELTVAMKGMKFTTGVLAGLNQFSGSPIIQGLLTGVGLKGSEKAFNFTKQAFSRQLMRKHQAAIQYKLAKEKLNPNDKDDGSDYNETFEQALARKQLWDRQQRINRANRLVNPPLPVPPSAFATAAMTGASYVGWAAVVVASTAAIYGSMKGILRGLETYGSVPIKSMIAGLKSKWDKIKEFPKEVTSSFIEQFANAWELEIGLMAAGGKLMMGKGKSSLETAKGAIKKAWYQYINQSQIAYDKIVQEVAEEDQDRAWNKSRFRERFTVKDVESLTESKSPVKYKSMMEAALASDAIKTFTATMDRLSKALKQSKDNIEETEKSSTEYFKKEKENSEKRVKYSEEYNKALYDYNERNKDIQENLNKTKMENDKTIWEDFKDRLTSASDRNGSYMGGTEGVKFAQESQQNAIKEQREHNKKMEELELKMWDSTEEAIKKQEESNKILDKILKALKTEDDTALAF